MNHPVEPSGNARAFAKFMFDMFTALVQEGFTDQQALVILGQMLAVNFGRPEGGE